ncbi:hypothetical protein [Actinoplanes sp. NPDC049802]|uniref:hypothetical protein n=1 Tax=Actinoplanes sp. NPDC049802 TaxID=3154742 RepID=UPI0033C5C2EA
MEVLIDDVAAVLDRAEAELRAADIDWAAEEDTLDEAVAELRADVPRALAGLIDPARLLRGIPGVSFGGAHCWADSA